ncbi:MAG TPA: NAD kinase [Bacteroidales bacterium]|jgi:NAD+ kinase|nr:NAD kinase [Bacteroidales bacterium]
MRIALFGKTFNTGFNPFIKELFDLFEARKIELVVYKPFLDFIMCETSEKRSVQGIFNNVSEFDRKSDLMISIGGDGTFLESIPFVIREQIPIIGINSGRLGFLANISKENITEAFQAIFAGDFTYEYRTLISINKPDGLFNGLNFALNDITIKSNSTLITIEAYINNEFLNTYWTDGLIISTPTGSTAYSLSVGGPVVVPGSGNLIIAPISSHNLTVRPLIIPDTNVITLKVYSRKGTYSVTADNRAIDLHNAETFMIGKSDFRLKMIKLPKTSFYETLRNKLKWGEDVRN